MIRPATYAIQNLGQKLIDKGVAPDKVCFVIDERFEAAWFNEGCFTPEWLDTDRVFMSTSVSGCVALPREEFDRVLVALHPTLESENDH